MPYLTEPDFHVLIQEQNLQQVIRADTSILLSAQRAAQAEIVSHLTQKYDCSAEFTDTSLWSISLSYLAGSRVYDTTVPYAQFFYAQLPAALFDSSARYATGNKVFWKNSVYTCVLPTDTSNQGSIQFGTYSNIPPLNIYPDDIINGLLYWGVAVPYSVPAATPLTSTTYWTPGDSRCPQLVMYAIDIALYILHSGISNRNVPELRASRFNQAMHWLKAAADGELTAPLPVLQPFKGRRSRFGGNIKNINSY